jgi:hypothetical protein
MPLLDLHEYKRYVAGHDFTTLHHITLLVKIIVYWDGKRSNLGGTHCCHIQGEGRFSTLKIKSADQRHVVLHRITFDYYFQAYSHGRHHSMWKSESWKIRV